MNEKKLSQVENILIILFAFVPLFVKLPYRINIFLSWEGAFRISNGQLPFRDFGSPIGGVYWMIPALFFKIFGPQMLSLIKAQVFLNIVSGFSFRSILKSLNYDPKARFIAVVVFVLSYSFINFWPWYNHSVIVYELLALAFILRHIFQGGTKNLIFGILMASFFSVCSFLTKQDAGGLTILICLILLLYTAITEKKAAALIIYMAGIVVFITIYISITNPGGFNYWFNHGQPPHSSRVHITDLLDEYFGGSLWIKFYLIFILLLSFHFLPDWKKNIRDKNIMIPILLTLGIQVEALIFGVTSYVPPDNNIFFHSFAIAFIMNGLIFIIPSLRKTSYFLITVFMVFLWWSPNYWRYIDSVVKPFAGSKKPEKAGPENLVDRNTFMISKVDMGIPASEWKESGFPTLKNIMLPVPTIEGISRLKRLEVLRDNRDPKVLNMSELTSLAAEIPYKLDKGPEYPLWFHLGVGMFNKQAEMFENRISANYYDLVLFEYIPSLNNFYPFRVREQLRNYYQITDSFPAPRRGETQGMIEIYMKKNQNK